MSHAVQGMRWLGAALILAIAAGCATGPNANKADPFEPVNRGVFRFNETVDKAVLKPVAKAYVNVLPSLVRTGVNNFFGNLAEVWTFANTLMQLKPQASAETFMRFNVNTFFGLGGLLDIATEMGIDRHTEDFGQTLGRWGVPPGPYVMLPLLGPSSVRDAAAFPLDRYGDAFSHVLNVEVRNSLTVVRLVDLRSNYLRAGQLLDDAALDKYSFTRDAWLQKRRNDVYDGNPPPELDARDDGLVSDGAMARIDAASADVPIKTPTVAPITVLPTDAAPGTTSASVLVPDAVLTFDSDLGSASPESPVTVIRTVGIGRD